MPIADGDPADVGDIWFRVLTDERYIRKGTVHPHAFKGKGVIGRPDPEKKRPWDHELSGRLRSLSATPAAEAEDYCAEMTKLHKQTKTFAGIMFCRLPDLRPLPNQINTGVHFTPLPNVKSHADFVLSG